MIIKKKVINYFGKVSSVGMIIGFINIYIHKICIRNGNLAKSVFIVVTG